MLTVLIGWLTVQFGLDCPDPDSFLAFVIFWLSSGLLSSVSLVSLFFDCLNKMVEFVYTVGRDYTKPSVSICDCVWIFHMFRGD
jgi:hypothetical protein